MKKIEKKIKNKKIKIKKKLYIVILKRNKN
jgi:ubiquitin